jgi:hypothetical protein
LSGVESVEAREISHESTVDSARTVRNDERPGIHREPVRSRAGDQAMEMEVLRETCPHVRIAVTPIVPLR